MIIKCNESYEKNILTYIGKDYFSCLYLYLNIKKYGFNSNKIDIYIQEKNNNISCVLLKYYSCLHIFSKNNDFELIELNSFIEHNSFSMIYCSAATADIIYSNLSKNIKNKSDITKGWVAKITNVDKKPNILPIYAKKEDFEQIIKLIYEDEDIGRSYNFEELTKQIEERNKEGYSRNVVIKKDGIVIAHACTNAETEDIAIVAELLVRKEYRRKGFASEIWRFFCNELLNEGKEVYSFYYSQGSRNLHKKIGFFEVCEWAKIVISN